MTTFDDREKGFERKFIRDQELTFKVNARRNKLLGLWAATKLGKQGAEAEQYAREIALVDFSSSSSHADLIEKLHTDFIQANVAVTARDIHAEMERLMPIAQAQVIGNAG